MKSVRRTSVGRVLRFHPGERDVLVHLVSILVDTIAELLPDAEDEFAVLLGREITAQDIARRDPVLHRLFPSAYPDASSDAEFRRYTEAEAARAKVDAASSVLGQLKSEDKVVVTDGDLDAWVRTLTSVRLMLSERDDSGLDDLFDWLGWVLESLLDA